MSAPIQAPEVIDHIESSLRAIAAQEAEIATLKQANTGLEQANAALTQENASLRSSQKAASAAGFAPDQAQRIADQMKQAGILTASEVPNAVSCLQKDVKYAARIIEDLIPLVPAPIHSERGHVVPRSPSKERGDVAARWIQ